jgi:hypothetical protein
MNSLQSIPVSSLAATTRPLDTSVRTAVNGSTVEQTAPVADANANIPSAFKIPRIDQVDDTPAIPPGLDLKNIKRAHAYADAFGMAVDPTKDVATEGVASLFARYDKQVSNVIDRIMKAKFTALLDVKV